MIIAAVTILNRGRAKADEIDFVLSAANGTAHHSDLVSELKPGRVTKKVRIYLEDLVETLIAESEEE